MFAPHTTQGQHPAAHSLVCVYGEHLQLGQACDAVRECCEGVVRCIEGHQAAAVTWHTHTAATKQHTGPHQQTALRAFLQVLVSNTKTRPPSRWRATQMLSPSCPLPMQVPALSQLVVGLFGGSDTRRKAGRRLVCPSATLAHLALRAAAAAGCSAAAAPPTSPAPQEPLPPPAVAGCARRRGWSARSAAPGRLAAAAAGCAPAVV